MKTGLSVLALLCGLSGCGPTIVAVKVVEAPRKKATPPAVSPEETAGSVPKLKPLVIPKLVPDNFRPQLPPADPEPVQLGP